MRRHERRSAGRGPQDPPHPRGVLFQRAGSCLGSGRAGRRADHGESTGPRTACARGAGRRQARPARKAIRADHGRGAPSCRSCGRTRGGADDQPELPLLSGRAGGRRHHTRGHTRRSRKRQPRLPALCQSSRAGGPPPLYDPAAAADGYGDPSLRPDALCDRPGAHGDRVPRVQSALEQFHGARGGDGHDRLRRRRVRQLPRELGQPGATDAVGRRVAYGVRRGEITWTSRADTGTDADRVTVRPLGKRPRRIELPPMPHYDRAGSLRAFVHAVEGGTEPESSGRDNLGSVALMHAAVESATSGTPVPVVGKRATRA